MRNIRGNSTIPCPMATKEPANFELKLLEMVAANTGPGIITPESDIPITVRRKKSKLPSPSRFKLGYNYIFVAYYVKFKIKKKKTKFLIR